MNTIQLSIQASEQEQEILISQFSDLGATGFEQKDDRLLAYFPESAFPSYEVNELIKHLEHQVNQIEEQNWNALWESNFPPVVVDDFCYVRADFHPEEKGFEHVIRIQPKMSFGTGHHATTYMMMRQMRNIDFRDKKVFDFGTGTGILAVLAEKLGAAAVLATDIDEWSIENAGENIRANNCSRISLELSSKVPDQHFGVILANINRNVILEHMEELKQILEPGGTVLFSGILNEDEEIIRAAAADLLDFQAAEQRQNWSCLRFSRRP